MRLELDRLMRRIQPGEASSPAGDLLLHLQEFGEHVDAAVRQVRRLSSELRPGVLDRLGLGAGIEWLLNQYTRRTGIETRFGMAGPERRVSADIATAFFRITQEALSNIARHSHATRVVVSLDYDDLQLHLTIQDNGDGFNPGVELSMPSLGLLGMQERARRLAGSLEIRSAPGCGTELTVLIPSPGNALSINEASITSNKREDATG